MKTKGLKTILSFFSIYLFACTSVDAQKITTFQHAYGGFPNLNGGNQYDISGGAIVLLPDKGFIFTGSGWNGGFTENNEISIVRTDSLGRIIWSKLYSGSLSFYGSGFYPGYTSYSNNLVLASDGNILVGSNLDSSYFVSSAYQHERAWLFKIDLNGTILWSKTYENNNVLGTNIVSVINDPSGGFTMAGWTDISNGGYGSPMVIRTDATGGVTWAKKYSDTTGTSSGNGYNYSIVPSRDSGYIIGGSIFFNFNNYNQDYQILKIDKNGKLVWSKNYGTSSNDFITSITELPDKSIYAFGYSYYSSSPYYPYEGTLQKLDSSGNILWSKKYDFGIGSFVSPTVQNFGFALYDSARKVFNLSLGNVAPNGLPAEGLMRLDTSGNLKLIRLYDKKYDYYDVSYWGSHNLIQLPSGGFACMGAFQDSALIGYGNGDFLLIKMDSNGLSHCNLDSMAPKVSGYPVQDRFYKIISTSDIKLTTGTGCKVDTIVTRDVVVCPPFVAWFRPKNTCVNAQALFLDSSYYKATSWHWDFGDSASVSNTSVKQNPSHTYSKAGAYQVKLVAGNGTVKDSLTQTLVVYPAPTPFKFDTLICAGNTITLRVSGGAAYKWSPAKLVSNPTSSTPTTTPKRTTTFIVQAISANGCIANDTIHVTVDQKPDPPQIDYATVKTNNEIDLKFQRSDSNDVSGYEVFRSANGGAYFIIKTIANQSNSDSFYTVKDSSVNGAADKYAYKILAVDSCGAVSDTSIVHQPMLLSVKKLGCTPSLQLRWTAYQGWPRVLGIKNYEVFRTVNGGADSLIATLANTATTYNDTGLNHNNIYCYKILAQDNADSFVSQSNTACKQTFFPDTPQILSVSKISTSTTHGTVVIKWNSINKANLAYNDLYFSRDRINFSQIGGHLLPVTDSLVQTGLDTKDSDYEYYLITIDSCGTQSVKSPTSKTMTLTVNVGQLLHKLNWTPYLGFKIKNYKIERLENGQFVTIDSVPGVDTASKEFPAPCNYAIRYRIAVIGYDSGETAWSDTMGRQAIDTIPSDPPVMFNATVLNGTSAKMNFIGSDSADTYEFAIQRSVDGNWGTAAAILFTKPGDSLQYIDTGINTIKNHICYTVIALDSCLNASSSDTFCLINLQGKGVQMSDSLMWYPFAGYDLNNYAILTLNQSGNWDTLTTVSGNDTDYYNANLQCGQTITYKIAGKEKSGSRLSFSDSITLTPIDTIKPSAPIVYYATILPNQSIKLNWQWNPKSIIKYFEIWRSVGGAALVLIDTVTADSTFIDTNVNVKSNVYSYSVIAIDSCNTANRSKPSVQNTLMNLSLYSLYCNPQVLVKWSPYSGLGVKNYSVYRSADGVNFTGIGTTNGSDTVFTDTVVVAGKQYDYKIEAIALTGYTSYSDSLGIIPKIIPDADSAQLIYATVLKSDETRGAIFIQWKRALLNDTNARGYYVYSYNPANGKYALLKDVTNLNDTSYIQDNLNTIQNVYKYYIITYNVCDVGINSNIHKTVLLKVQSNNLNEQLNWTNYLGVGVRSYSVYKSEDGGPQSLLANAGIDSAYSDSDIACNHNFTYQIQAILANGEISFSDSVTVKSFDTIRPKTKPIVVATILESGLKDGRIELDWLAAFDNNLAGYNIYRSIDGLYWSLIIDHWPGTSLIDTGLDTYDQPYYYKIQPVDSCGNVGTYTIYHETIHLKASANNGYNQLYWNGYAGWQVKQYLVYKNGILVATLANNVFAFKDTAVICQNVYQYLIKAVDSVNDTIVSASNTDSAKAQSNNPPKAVYIKTVSVSSPNKAVTISWNPSTSFDVKDYFIYRKSYETGNLKFVDSTSFTTYIDSSESVTEPDCYYVFARDHCRNQSNGSNQGCIIILNAKNQPGSNQLTWNSYQNWPDGVQSYNVYKQEDSSGWQMIGTTSSVQTNAFEDKNLGDSTVSFCYQVEAIENPGQYNQLSRSTVECVHQDATVFIPNSFTPYNADGLNDLFGPKGAYIKDYSMQIYNRWGEQVYSSPSPEGEGRGEAGWDGTYKGQPVQQGIYIYLITVEDYNGKKSYFKGTITMFQ